MTPIDGAADEREPFVIAKTADGEDVLFRPALANRHGLITGATGTGKTVTLQVLADHFSALGVPVFLADVKGDLSGLAAAGASSPKLQERLKATGVDAAGVARESGRCSGTCSASAAFRSARDHFRSRAAAARAPVRSEPDAAGRARAGVQDRRRHGPAAARPQGSARDAAVRRRQRARSSRTEYGNISAASIGAIQRALLEVEQQGGDAVLRRADARTSTTCCRPTRTAAASSTCSRPTSWSASPKVYATFLLWLLSELFERLPEVGDPEKPKLVFFFDEAHLLFDDAPDLRWSRRSSRSCG